MIDPSEQFYWQQWEVFNVKFWALRYCLFSALGYKKLKLKELLKGARYSVHIDVDVDVDIPNYTSVCTHYLNNQYPPSNHDYNMLDNEGKLCNISSNDNSKIYKNGGGAKGDGFCFLIIKERPVFLSLARPRFSGTLKN